MCSISLTFERSYYYYVANVRKMNGAFDILPQKKKCLKDDLNQNSQAK